MNIFKILSNGILKRRNVESTINEIDLSSPVVELKRDDVVFESDNITQISTNEFIDATDSLNIQKYKNNIRLLVDEARSKGEISKFVTIREDDIFPYGWEWRKASSSTSVEYGKCALTYELRMAKAEEIVNPNKIFSGINIPVDEREINKVARSIEPMYGRIVMPSHFRSTKHFTINTPLGYTGSYNSGISADRKFIVIDDVSSFINSGYGYSADYMDAYLDITHENMPITEKAIVLISDDNYHEVIKDESIREQLSGRRVIRYKGDESLAINMVLSENGVLPSRPGGFYGYYQDDVQLILENSMRKLCDDNNLLYAQGHGNIDGVGGHFTDLYDSMYPDDLSFSKRLADFLRVKFPEYASIINDNILNHPGDTVKKIGPDKINEALLLFNDLEKKRVSDSRLKYDQERDFLPDEVRRLFKHTVSIINRFYSQEDMRNNDFEIRDLIRQFYHSDDVQVQISSAKEIILYIQRKLNINSNYSI